MKPALTEDDDVLHALHAACKDLGIDLKDVLVKLQLSEKLLSQAGQLVPSHLLNIVLETIAKDFHCHDIALHIARKLQSPQLGLPTMLMALSSDVAAGLNHASHYTAFYHDTGYWQSQISGDHVTLFKSTNSFSQKYYRQRNLLGTAQMFLLLSNLSGHLWRPDKVDFSFADPGANFSKTFHDFFDCDIRFDQANDAIHFPVDYLEFSIHSSDPTLLRSMELHIKSLHEELLHNRNFIERARLLLDERLRFSHCSEDELAFYMDLSTADLKRELQSANTDFDSLLEQQVCKRASHYQSQVHVPNDVIASMLMPDNTPHFYELFYSE
ncbi:Uncharacterised protein [Zhongshania aliphaticivorans]|uniref:HTH-type transcriptional regulator AraC-type N-terminal domain-containing protein n=1 Tax=Zhongshania aliphaticivorans TaxID=1470434 RepID=A0A5S9NB46_9GAMM|nr:AraC family transcriptional regulator ligand-binding domain-containing protein [Zhongshania aliphaticivorans]CAA0078977.1 Uncharacterised protein [Zhongshania aliphaticivorans]CAA0086350.1 Uncharacterised protein [Zhongshania aliphaticivorans]